MITLKRLLNKITKKTEEGMKAYEVTKDEKAAYEKRIAELEDELVNAQEELRFEYEKSTSEINRLEELLELAQIKIEELKGTIKKLQHYKYGHSSEKSKYLEKASNNNVQSQEDSNQANSEIEAKPESENNANQSDFERKVQNIKADMDETAERKKKGGQQGHKGHGRKIPKNLKKVTQIFELLEEDCKCPVCGKKYRVIKKFFRKSHEIELLIELLLKEHVQYVYEKECTCDKNAPLLIVAPKPESIIYKSVFSTGTWCKFLAMKYLTGIPINKFNELTNETNYTFNPATILGGFEKLLEVMMPLYEEIIRYNQNESRWHADETRWCRLLDTDGKKRRLYWIWVFVGKQSVVYTIDATRSKSVPEKHFKNTKEGILNVDRLSVYNVVSDKIKLSYCWYHLRRDYINIGKKYKDLTQWSITWMLKIRDIERINRSRLQQDQALNSDYQRELIQKIDEFFQDASNELSNKGLNKDQKKVLKSLIAKRDGYTVFIDHSEVPMHNNVAEHQFRHVAYARNSYGGSKSEWGGELAAVTWTIFKTATLNSLNPVNYLMAFFKKYIATNGFGKEIPQDILPWNYNEPGNSVEFLNSG